MYSKQRNSNGSGKAEEQEEHIIPDTGKPVRKYKISSTRARRHTPGYFELKNMLNDSKGLLTADCLR